MSAGKAYINGLDIYTTYGAQLIRGAYEALLTPAPMKDYISNQSRKEAGIRVVANSTTSKMDSRELQLSVFITGTSRSDYLAKYGNFVSAISQGLFTLQVPALGKTFRLVYTGCSKYGDYGVKRGKFVLRLVEPDPTNRTNSTT